jgi:hypothetical protein
MGQARLAVRCLLVTMLVAFATGESASGAERSLTQPAKPISFACFQMRCGMPERGAYPHLVVGRIVAVANAAQAHTLFDAMRRRGRWSGLPASGDTFWKNLQPVAIDVGSGTVMVTLTSQDEMHAAPLEVGDFVRYSPHRGRYETPPTDKTAAAFWAVDGCVAVLCRATDRQCMTHYLSGIFDVESGVQLANGSLKPLRHGAVIDTLTMWPKRAARTQ